MYVVWLSPGGFGGFTGIFRDAEICPGFPPPKAALVTVTPPPFGCLFIDFSDDTLTIHGMLKIGNSHLKSRVRLSREFILAVSKQKRND